MSIEEQGKLVGYSIGDSFGVVLAMDDAVCDLIHRSRSQAIGLSYLEFTHPQDRLRNTAKLDELRPNGLPSQIRKRYLRPDGSFVAVELAVSRLSAPTDAGRLVGTIRLPSTFAGISHPERLQARAKHAVELAIRRNAEFGPEMAGDHAWIILLQLYLAEIECRIVCLDEICDMMRFPRAVIVRWVWALSLKGLVEKTDDLSAQQLTTMGFAAVERILDAG